MVLPHIKLFEKTKVGTQLVSLPHFMHDFWRKLFLLLYSITWPNFITWLPLLCKIFGNMCVVIVCWSLWSYWKSWGLIYLASLSWEFFTTCQPLNFLINLYLLICITLLKAKPKQASPEWRGMHVVSIKHFSRIRLSVDCCRRFKNITVPINLKYAMRCIYDRCLMFHLMI